jgi:hypothetical protein
MAKISGSLERIWMAIPARSVTHIIWNTRQHTGIVSTTEFCEMPSENLDHLFQN